MNATTALQTLTAPELRGAIAHSKAALRRYRDAVKWHAWCDKADKDYNDMPRRFSKDSKHDMYADVRYLNTLLARPRAEQLPDVYRSLLAAKEAGWISAGTTVPAPPASTYITVAPQTV